MHPFMHQISITYRCAMRYRDHELAQIGLSGCQTPYLIALYRHPGITQEALAQHLHVNKSSVARQLSALEANGYVRREASPEDRRILRVYPTDKALAAQDRLREVLRGWSSYLTEDFTEEERETLSRLMRRIADRAEQYMEGSEAGCTPSDTI